MEPKDALRELDRPTAVDAQRFCVVDADAVKQAREALREKVAKDEAERAALRPTLAEMEKCIGIGPCHGCGAEWPYCCSDSSTKMTAAAETLKQLRERGGAILGKHGTSAFNDQLRFMAQLEAITLLRDLGVTPA